MQTKIRKILEGGIHFFASFLEKSSINDLLCAVVSENFFEKRQKMHHKTGNRRCEKVTENIN